MEHLACNVYQWGRPSADRLLAECLAPEVLALRREGLARSFWFQRFDARGPHLFVLVAAPAGQGGALRTRLDARLAAWLARHPCPERLPDDVLAARHAQCRGKQLSALDAEPGFALNNTVAWAAHPAHGYPLWLTAGVAEEEALWDLLSGLAAWTAAGTGSAVRWVADVDAALRRAHPEAGGAWPHHASTLLMDLEERMARDAAVVLDALPRVIGAGNAARFGSVWDAAERGPSAWAPLPELLRIILADDGRSPDARLRLLREVNHGVLGQLGQPVAAHVPLVLFAWTRWLVPRPEAA
ncbi:lantibiotic dehydratase C-terminal domain-containing protein [Longimicrobium sp.]|uniref:lantibiotic dehydratase C-terminal domain-containing protein n=1 Tax=Longimicrobium sp. TaxID=2029185 RepID=UPI002E343982|nr:lantibiotic dehydratase C-terminal domain-containing protein [Longimicrobium sp.]HEX6039514.1 lantibiotic dehydratase C-terminal domain-containing protein [Longimicrobium sp.]